MNQNLDTLGELEVSYKYKSNLSEKPKINSSLDAYHIASKFITQDAIGLQEKLIVLYLNNCNIFIGCLNEFSGSLTSTTFDVKMIVGTGIKLMASAAIVIHNHPSGNLNPSNEDLKATEKLKVALNYMDIKLLDHLIISPDYRYLSFSDEGLL